MAAGMVALQLAGCAAISDRGFPLREYPPPAVSAEYSSAGSTCPTAPDCRPCPQHPPDYGWQCNGCRSILCGTLFGGGASECSPLAAPYCEPPVVVYQQQSPTSPVGLAIDPASGQVQSVVIADDPSCHNQSAWSNLLEYPIAHNLIADECNFYSCPSLAWLGVGIGGAAILANTNLDQEFRNFYQERIRGNIDLEWADKLGNGIYVIPSLAGIWAIDYWINSNYSGNEPPVTAWLEEWSGRSLRGLIVGAVPVLTLQYALGSSRPGESSAGSRWKPFTDTNGVSGHAFVGAVTFFTAAQVTEYVPLKVGFVALGLLPGVGRIHQDAHYLSQVALGWWIAGLSVAAVDCTEYQRRQWTISPTIMGDGSPGMALMGQW
jgi:hypothetical protein